jgi:phosphoglycerol transferase MdoB-like AlkP superfamily enzyme
MEELKSRAKSLTVGLAFAYFLFTLSRLVFLAFNWQFFSSSAPNDIAEAFLIGVWFDTVPVFYYNLLFILMLILPHPWSKKPVFHNTLIVVFIFTNGVALFQNLLDVAYFPFNKKRTGAEILHLSQELNLKQSIAYLVDFWYVTLILVVVLILSYRFAKRYSAQIHNKQNPELATRNPQLIIKWVTFILSSLAITFIGLRGSFGLIPLRTFDAGRYVNTQLIPLAINTPFQFICTVEGNSAPTFDFMPQSEADRIIQPIKHDSLKAFQKKNVVIIIVESLGKEYMGFYNQGKGYTPFLDSICRVSLTFEHSFANGTTSMDAPPAILACIPSLLDDSYMISQFNINTPQSIGSILTTKGYNSSFYHAGKNGTMGFDNFISLCRMGNYYGLNEYPNKEDYDGTWGIFDEPYLQYFSEELTNKKQPFISTIFTLSSHHPYTVPKRYENALPKGSLPIHQSIAYADLSLRHFFEKAKQQPWYVNTLFVITADHTSDSENPVYQTPLGRYAIPFILYSPSDSSLKGVRSNVTQQSLLTPTILDYLGYNKPFFSLGKSALDTTSYAVFHSGGTYSLAKGNFVFTMQKGDISFLYNSSIDPHLQHDISTSYPKEKKEMERLLKAYLQTYIQRLTNNTFKSE